MATFKDTETLSALDTFLAENPDVAFKKDIRQRDLETYEEYYNKLGINDVQGQNRVNSRLIKAAVSAGWITGFDVATLPDMEGWDVTALAVEVMRIYGEKGHIDPLT